MTQREIERKKEEYVSVLADKTKDIQMQAQSIKNPEDESKNTQIYENQRCDRRYDKSI